MISGASFRPVGFSLHNETQRIDDFDATTEIGFPCKVMIRVGNPFMSWDPMCKRLAVVKHATKLFDMATAPTSSPTCICSSLHAVWRSDDAWCTTTLAPKEAVFGGTARANTWQFFVSGMLISTTRTTSTGIAENYHMAAPVIGHAECTCKAHMALSRKIKTFQ